MSNELEERKEVLAEFLKVGKSKPEVWKKKEKVFANTMNEKEYLILTQEEKWEKGIDILKDWFLGGEMTISIQKLSEITKLDERTFGLIREQHEPFSSQRNTIINYKEIVDIVENTCGVEHLATELLKKLGFAGILSPNYNKEYLHKGYFIYPQ